MSLNFLVFNERQAHDSDIFSLALHQNSNTILSTSSDGTIKSWDLTSSDHKSTIDSAFAIGGHSIACAENAVVGVGFAGDLKSFDLSSCTTLQDLSSPFSSPDIDWSTAISPDGTTIATTTSNGTLKVTDLASSSTVATLDTRGKFGLCVAYAPDNRTIATGHLGGGVFLFDTTLGAHAHSFSQLLHVRALSFSPDSEVLASVGDAKVVAIHDVKTGEQVSCLTGHQSLITAVDFNASGELLVTGSIDGRVKVWHLARKECVATVTENVGHKIWCVKWAKMGPGKVEGFVVGGSEKVLRFYLPTTQ